MKTSSRRIELPHGITLHVREGGQGSPTTLLIHGWGVPGVVWEPVIERWPDDAGRLIAPDLRGAGWSSKPREGYQIDDHVTDILALIDALELSNIVLVGHSKGGAIAQRVALERPSALAKIIVVCSVPASGVPFDAGTTAFFRSLCGHRDGAATLINMTAANPESIPRDRVERLVDSMASVCMESLLEGFDAWRTANFGDRIGAITTPTLVLGGEADKALPPAFLKEFIVDKIPGATLELLAGCGHYPQLECPDELTKALVRAGSAKGQLA